MLDTKFLGLLRAWLGRGGTPKTYALPSAEVQRRMSEYFCARNTDAIERVVLEHYGGARINVGFDPSAVHFPMSCAWTRSAAKGPSFTFPSFEWGHLLETVVVRWLSLFDLFLHLEKPGNPTGRILINFNDAGLEPGLAFSANGTDYILIPDSDFLRSHGYVMARKHFARDLHPWEQRSTTVFWRGSAIGQKNHALLDMPRARLCRIVKTAPGDWFDVGLVETFGLGESETAQLRAADLIKGRVPWKHLNRYRFHIDIDGHANSYTGLFFKLLSGGLVLKVASPDDYSQWYYDQLKPWENFVPVRSDLSDLLETVSYCREHDELARRIAHHGRRLARSLTFNQEFARAVQSVKRAFARSQTSSHSSSPAFSD